MTTAVDEIQAQIDALLEKKREREAFEAKLGKENVAVDEYHSTVCRWNHDDRCNYGYDSMDVFDVDGTTKNRFKKEYLTKKDETEKVLSVALTHEEFLNLVKIIR